MNSPQRKGDHPDGNEKQLFTQRGDFVISEDAFPKADCIVLRHWETKTPEFNRDFFQSYLDFLELVVLNERILVGLDTSTAALSSDLKKTRAFDRLFTKYRLRGELNLEDQINDALERESILFNKVELCMADCAPDEHLSKYLSLPAVERRLREIRKFCKEDEMDEVVVEILSRASLSSELGVPLYLSEFARRSQLPYSLNPMEIIHLSKLDSLEATVHTTVREYLSKTLNESARDDLRRISTVGGTTVFPETPISSQIVMNSNSPEDLLAVALQLRSEYAQFRGEMIELETELISEDASLKRKLKMQAQVEALARQLWPVTSGGIRKEASELSGLLALLPVDGVSIGSAAKLGQYILTKPWDLLLQTMRRRKVRVLLKSRKQFLNAKSCSQKLSQIFGLPTSIIKTGLNAQP